MFHYCNLFMFPPSFFFPQLFHNVTYVIHAFPLLSGEELNKLHFRSNPVDLYCVLLHIAKLLLNKYV